MIALVTGGAASGKSAYAESLAKALPGPHAYVATMRHGDAETEARIARHREMRAGKGFVTVELAGGEEGSPPLAQANRSSLSGGGLPEEGSCLARANRSLLQRDGSANSPLCGSDSADPSGRAFAPHSPRNRTHPLQADLFSECKTALLEDLGNLVANGLQEKIEDVLAFDNVVIVANEVGCDGIQYDPFTMDYIEKLGTLACQLGARADVVVEVVAGIPNVVKGEVPAGC
ncbi:MAG: bifunctional adenosylcobinamide kinase/adenosylcobinamide-phosphate guanylyltransferase [Eggerthellaceae bacterium]|nr:bifunctional adenosylcobinamide kinase/adenosylcobinamide-phosphate guanylyltransferase [Eggerthellaceae bacterium]